MHILVEQRSRRVQSGGNEQKFPKNTSLKTVRAVQTPIDRKAAHNMLVLQDWKTFGWSRITLLSGPTAKKIGMKAHVFSYSAFCVGVSNPDPCNNWVTKLDEVWNEHGFAEKLDLSAREIKVAWHVLPGASTIDTKKHIREWAQSTMIEGRIVFLSMFNDIDWTQKRNEQRCLRNAREVAECWAMFKPGHWLFFGPASQDTGWNGNPKKKKESGKPQH